MEFALVEGRLSTAEPSTRGQCPHCGEDLIARCGQIKVWHWSHVGKRHCDPWWEPETQWHRNWKGNFPADWHEVGDRAPDGERHIADIKTAHGLVIEFQHSPIALAERIARTNFHGNIIWVVDGLRDPKDRGQFSTSIKNWNRGRGRVFSYDIAEWTVPKGWLDCPVPTFVDFGPDNILPPEVVPYQEHWLWCLLPWHPTAPRLILAMTKDDFVARTLMAHPIPGWAEMSDQFLAKREEQRKLAAQRNLRGLVRWR